MPVRAVTSPLRPGLKTLSTPLTEMAGPGWAGDVTSPPRTTAHQDPVEDVDEPDEEDAEHSGGDDRAVEPGGVGEVLL